MADQTPKDEASKEDVERIKKMVYDYAAFRKGDREYMREANMSPKEWDNEVTKKNVRDGGGIDFGVYIDQPSHPAVLEKFWPVVVAGNEKLIFDYIDAEKHKQEVIAKNFKKYHIPVDEEEEKLVNSIIKEKLPPERQKEIEKASEDERDKFTNLMLKLDDKEQALLNKMYPEGGIPDQVKYSGPADLGIAHGVLTAATYAAQSEFSKEQKIRNNKNNKPDKSNEGSSVEKPNPMQTALAQFKDNEGSFIPNQLPTSVPLSGKAKGGGRIA